MQQCGRSFRVFLSGRGCQQRRLLFHPSSQESSDFFFAATRRHFSSEPRARSSSVHSKRLERYTSDVLKSHRLPLGTVREEQWEDIVAAVHHWLHEMKGSGQAVESAHHLLRRLVFEQSATSESLLRHERTTRLLELHLQVLDSWLALHRQHSRSALALVRADAAFREWFHLRSTSYSNEEFPLEEVSTLLSGWLRHAQGPEKVANLFLLLTDSLDNFVTPFSAHLSPYFNQALSALVSRQSANGDEANPLVEQVIERMESLQSGGSWKRLVPSRQAAAQPIVEMPEDTVHHEKQFQKSSSTRQDAEPSPSTLSSFEAAAMQERLVKLLRESDASNPIALGKVESTIRAMPDPSEDLMLAVVDYLLRANDAQGATVWIKDLPPSAVLASPSPDSLSPMEQLLNVWSHSKNPRAPWRAEEIFLHILSQRDPDTTVPLSTVNRMLQLWHDSNDPAGDRKVKDWLSRMTDTLNLTPDSTSLKYAVKGVEGSSGNLAMILDNIEQEWPTLSLPDRQQMVSTLLNTLADTKTLPPSTVSLHSLLRDEELDISMDQYQHFLQCVFADADLVDIASAVETTPAEANPADLVLYVAAIQNILRHEKRQSRVASQIWKHALAAIAKDSKNVKEQAVSEFVVSVVKILKFRKMFTAADSFLSDAEKVLLNDNAKGSCMIPLEAYRLLVVRGWYTEQTAPAVIRLFEHLQSLVAKGHGDLQPDGEMFSAYVRAKAVLSKEADELDSLLKEAISLFHATGDQTYIPRLDAFNQVLAAYGSDRANRGTIATRSIDLWQQMIQLGVIPDGKAFAFAASNILSHPAKGVEVFRNVVTIMEQIQQHGVEPDTRALHLVMSACGQAGPGEKKEALELCLKTFGDIRQKGGVSVSTYTILTRVLRRLLKQGSVADKVASKTLRLCYEDGLLGPKVREAYQALMSGNIWEEEYKKRLNGAKEPTEWTRRLQKQQ
eukprot:Nitzschia sp. Nitz4//scaffold61_size107673//81570//84434//NITZ4_004249-RA/size107673-processed-gene-0.91-mRNA-1//-1//CDS//3329555752//5143//frame0